jgi:hypothetical protein
MITTWILSFFAGYLGVLLGFRFALDRVAMARAKVAALRKERLQQIFAIRESARGCLATKRKMRENDVTIDQLAGEVRNLEDQVKAIHKSDTRLVVLDERRLPEDHRWIVVISGVGDLLPDATGEEGHENWSGSLRFLVWATTLDRAIQKAITRFPPSRGFKVEAASAPGKAGPSQAA